MYIIIYNPQSAYNRASKILYIVDYVYTNKYKIDNTIRGCVINKIFYWQ